MVCLLAVPHNLPQHPCRQRHRSTRIPGKAKCLNDHRSDYSLHLPVRGSAITLVVFRGCRVHSELKHVLLLRPASWLALLTRTFTFELALAGSPRTGVEYDYVGKQSIPTTGLSPASPTALWAAVPGPTPGSPTPGSRPTPRSRHTSPVCRRFAVGSVRMCTEGLFHYLIGTEPHAMLLEGTHQGRLNFPKSKTCLCASPE
jgi:hypothetical protein